MEPEPPLKRVEYKMTLSNFLRQQNQCTPLPHSLTCVELLGRVNTGGLSDANL